MSIREEQYKDFLVSSLKNNELYEKVYIISLHTNDDKDYIPDPPYSFKFHGLSDIKIGKNKYVIPDMIKHVVLLDKKQDGKIVSEENTLKLLDNYQADLSILDKILFMLRTDIADLEFYMMKDVFKVMDHMRYIVYEYKLSALWIKNNEFMKTIENIESNLLELSNTMANRAQYLDMRTSRILNIITLCTLPSLVLMTWWSTDIHNNVGFSDKFNEVLYRLTVLICVLIILYVLYLYRYDLFF